jgi:hypothetical protein
MADESQVLDTLVGVIAGALYPNGTGQPSAAGMPCRVYRGWPNAAQLDADLAAGTSHVSIFARNGVEQVKTRYLWDWQQIAPPVHTITTAVSGTTLTFGGTISTPQNVAVQAPGGATVVYAVQATDTLSGLASAIQALLSAKGVACSAAGPVLTAPGGFTFARVAGIGAVIREIRRQNKSIQVTLWCSSPGNRDAVAQVIDPALAAINFIALPDGSSGLVRYERTTSDDAPQKELLWRRDLFYWVEYPTTQVQSAYEVVDVIANSTGSQVPHAAPIVTTNS